VVLEFWFELASTYSYPAAARVERVMGEAGVALVWKPFLLGPVFQAQGWQDSPFNLYQSKGRYMWRDLERLCEAQGLPFRRPSVFPRNTVLAARIALVGVEQGFCARFARAVYHANFAEDRDVAQPAELLAILGSLGLDGPAIREQAESPAWKPRLREQAEQATARGIFGAPSFVFEGELFWGQDRLEQAVAWTKAQR
jgi:2-hydroxychromene-2-carboxylate isomerase